MTHGSYKLIEDFMRSSMDLCAHDVEHVYRVLYNALNIAEGERDVDYNVLIAAALLHDIGRPDQLKDPSVCHAKAGAKKAYVFLTENGFNEGFSRHVSECILSHRFRADNPPESIEAKILFDADKLDATGALGIARTLIYNGQTGRALYAVNESGAPVLKEKDGDDSFFREYNFKLKNLYGRFFTRSGALLAEKRRKAAADFAESLCREIEEPRKTADINDYLNGE